jgi:hypothetical protein
MGKGTNGPLGKMTGRTGNLVWRITKNGNVLATKPHKSHVPATEGQLKVRNKLSLMSSFISRITGLINIGFKNYTSKMSATNAAVSYNIKHAVKEEAGEFEIDYSKFAFSRGPLFEPDEPAAVVEVGQKIVVSWDPEKEDTAYNSDTDLLTVLVYNPRMEEFCIASNKAARADGIYTMTLPRVFEGDTVHCYINFISEKGKVSDSVYLGNLLIV